MTQGQLIINTTWIPTYKDVKKPQWKSFSSSSVSSSREIRERNSKTIKCNWRDSFKIANLFKFFTAAAVVFVIKNK